MNLYINYYRVYYFFPAFMCHHNTFLLYTSIENATQSRWDVVTHISLFTSLVVACLFGIAGYATFTAFSQGRYVKYYSLSFSCKAVTINKRIA